MLSLLFLSPSLSLSSHSPLSLSFIHPLSFCLSLALSSLFPLPLFSVFPSSLSLSVICLSLADRAPESCHSALQPKRAKERSRGRCTQEMCVYESVCVCVCVWVCVCVCVWVGVCVCRHSLLESLPPRSWKSWKSHRILKSHFP